MIVRRCNTLSYDSSWRPGVQTYSTRIHQQNHTLALFCFTIQPSKHAGEKILSRYPVRVYVSISNLLAWRLLYPDYPEGRRKNYIYRMSLMLLAFLLMCSVPLLALDACVAGIGVMIARKLRNV